MSSLKELMNQELPLNRKERFFTGTVLPMIVCRDNFKYFAEFLELLGCSECSPVTVNANAINIQFFTEYSLVESILKSERTRFSNPPKTKDTPDIVVLLKNDNNTKILISIEAKMYHTPDAQSLKIQLDNQMNNILKYIQEKLSIDKIYHYALLPEKLYDKLKKDGFDYPTITWEQIYETYKRIYEIDYFLDTLNIALESYDNLAAERRHFGQNSQGKLTGDDIYKHFKAKDLNKVVMGRLFGINREHLVEDIDSGRWRKQQYEVSDVITPPNENWFYIKDFVERIDQAERAQNMPAYSD